MSSTSSAVPPATISGRRFVGILLTVIALLLLFAFAGWFRTKANRSRPHLGVPMQNVPRLNPVRQ